MNILQPTLLFALILLCGQSIAQCDDYITKSYDKFTQKTTTSVKKELLLEKNGISFKLKPLLPSNHYSRIEVSVANHTKQAHTIDKKVEVVILFSDSTTLKLFDDHFYSTGTIKSETNQALTISFAPFIVSTEHMDGLDQAQKEYMQKMKNKKISAIRFSGIGRSNIDIDLSGQQQVYFMDIYNCI